MPKCTDQTIGFGRLGRRAIEANFEGGDIGSDGGVLLLKRVDERIELSRAAAAVLSDPRDPARITQMVEETRKLPSYRGQPIVFNEDDHFDFGKPQNNMLAALRAYSSWGYFDYRMTGERFDDGYQSVPVNWTISSPRKREFFALLSKVTCVGSAAP